MLGQRHHIYNDEFASLKVTPGDDWMSLLPIVKQGEGKNVIIDFDCLTHDFRRLTYTLQHCEADWTQSEEVLPSDFCDGFTEGNTIEDNWQSLNTTQLYTHYRLTLPNERCRPTLSGNYRLTVYDETDGDPVPALEVCFMVVEPKMTVGLKMTTNTDVDINRSHQQVEMTLDYGSLTVTDPARQIKTVVLQNGRWDNAAFSPTPQFVSNDGLGWSHNRALIFPAGNEYRKFETLDPTHTTMGLDRVGWDGTRYHAWVWTDEPRPNYIYDEDADGAFVIRNSDNVEIDYTCDYITTHFCLKSPKLPNDVYLDGQFTNGDRSPLYIMVWNDQEQQYEVALPLKQGYYNYQYLTSAPDGKPMPVPSEGSFFQTENQYEALIYYRGQGGRTDRLVGYGEWKERKADD